MNTQIDFKRIDNDTNGNPRYVCHFLNLLTDTESNNYDISISDKYIIALNRAKKIGGKKFHNKQYGGGIVFQSYNIQTTQTDIQTLLN
jgi:hypothetical protein